MTDDGRYAMTVVRGDRTAGGRLDRLNAIKCPQRTNHGAKFLGTDGSRVANGMRVVLREVLNGYGVRNANKDMSGKRTATKKSFTTRMAQ